MYQHTTAQKRRSSVKGLIIFIVFLNDVVQYLSLHLCFIAKEIYDTCNLYLFYSNRDYSELERIVNIDLSKLADWFKANKLSLNAAKTNFIFWV